jgi:Icc-related predicted phosphoesterase
MKISIMSDLHLEFAPLSGFPGGDVLILAGDIWLVRDMRPEKNDAGSRSRRKRYVKFCREELSKYSLVLVVTGNHEAYGDLYDDVHVVLRAFLSDNAPHAVVLINETIQLSGLAFLGTPLWSSCGTSNSALEKTVRRGMNDFRLIRTRRAIGEGDWAHPGKGLSRTFTPRDANALHQEAVTWLQGELPRHASCIVIGHHAPSFRSAVGHHHGDAGLDTAYCASLDELIEEHRQIKLWVHGHTHREENYRIGTTRIIANPRGYFPDEPGSHSFNPAAADFELAELIA